jgi:predicted glycosyltransferase
MSRRRVLIYVQHLLGTGHLRRAASIARATAGRGLDVTVATGGVPVDGVDFGAAKVVQLPAARVAAGEFGRLLDARGVPVDDAWRDRRARCLLDTWNADLPDILVTELFPFGRRQMRFELLPLLDAAAKRQPRPAIVASVRDILVGQDKPGRAAWVCDMIDRFYDRVLVHGDPDLVPLDASFPATGRIADRISYTGYVVDLSRPAPPPDVGAGEIIVSAGGGAVGRHLLETAIAAKALCGTGSRVWRLLAGTVEAAAALRSSLRDGETGIVIEPARSDFPALLGRAALSISQAGYNTTAEVLSSGVRAVLVPYDAAGESEQPLRARYLAERGRAVVVAGATLSAANLAAAVDRALAASAPPATSVDLDGADRTAALLASGIVIARARRGSAG